MRGDDVRCAGERGGHSASVSVDASGNMDAARAAVGRRWERALLAALTDEFTDK